MSKSPIYYPEEQGEGRASILRVFKKEQNANLEKSIINQLSPLANHISLGLDVANGGHTVVFVDVDSNAKVPDLPVPKGEFNLSYAFRTARGLRNSPKAGYYLCSLMRVPKDNQPAFLAAIDAYSRGMFFSADINVTFMHVVIAEEDPEVVMSFQGFPTENDAKHYYNHRWHWNFAPAVVNLLTALVGQWEGKLEEQNISKL